MLTIFRRYSLEQPFRKSILISQWEIDAGDHLAQADYKGGKQRRIKLVTSGTT
jgi:hypothetical protein